jgi:hypothetical protein
MRNFQEFPGKERKGKKRKGRPTTAAQEEGKDNSRRSRADGGMMISINRF